MEENKMLAIELAKALIQNNNVFPTMNQKNQLIFCLKERDEIHFRYFRDIVQEFLNQLNEIEDL